LNGEGGFTDKGAESETQERGHLWTILPFVGGRSTLDREFEIIRTDLKKKEQWGEKKEETLTHRRKAYRGCTGFTKIPTKRGKDGHPTGRGFGRNHFSMQDAQAVKSGGKGNNGLVYA